MNLQLRRVKHAVSSPIILYMIVPIFFFDVCLEFYHQIYFRICNIPLVSRTEYIRIDRHRLEYLNIIEKVFCAYCGYANGLMAYGVEIAARSELYWCGIKHKKYDDFKQPKHHEHFAEYGEQAVWEEKFRDCNFFNNKK